MRTIEFRGKRLDNGEWAYGDFEYNRKKTVARIHTYDEDGNYESQYVVDNTTVGQYMGLKDKNGKEIYEGDILLLSDKKSHSEEVVVEHGLYGWTFYNPQTATFYPDGSHTYAAVENCRFMFGTGIIIGNIHDDPELLKGGAE